MNKPDFSKLIIAGLLITLAPVALLNLWVMASFPRLLSIDTLERQCEHRLDLATANRQLSMWRADRLHQELDNIEARRRLYEGGRHQMTSAQQAEIASAFKLLAGELNRERQQKRIATGPFAWY